jgi:hypothetical protein
MGAVVTRRRTSKPPYSGFIGFWCRLGNTSKRMTGKIGIGKKEWVAMNEILPIRNKIILGDFLVIAAFPRLLQQDRNHCREACWSASCLPSMGLPLSTQHKCTLFFGGHLW